MLLLPIISSNRTLFTNSSNNSSHAGVATAVRIVATMRVIAAIIATLVTIMMTIVVIITLAIIVATIIATTIVTTDTEFQEFAPSCAFCLPLCRKHHNWEVALQLEIRTLCELLFALQSQFAPLTATDTNYDYQQQVL